MPETDIRKLDDAAAYFDVSIPTFKRWLKQDGFPIVQAGGRGRGYRLDVIAIEKWKDLQDKADGILEGEEANQDDLIRHEILGADALPLIGGKNASAKGRSEILRAEKDTINIAVQRRQLVNAADMQEMQVAVFKDIKDMLRIMPDDIATEFHLSDEIRDAMLERIDTALNDAANTLERMKSIEIKTAA